MYIASYKMLCSVKVGAVHFPKNLDVMNLEGRLLLVGTGGGTKTEIDSIGKVPHTPLSTSSYLDFQGAKE